MKSRIPKLDKQAFSVGSLYDDTEEKNYWLSMKPDERLQAIEINRLMVYGEDKITSRLQRFLETSSLSRS